MHNKQRELTNVMYYPVYVTAIFSPCKCIMPSPGPLSTIYRMYCNERWQKGDFQCAPSNFRNYCLEFSGLLVAALTAIVWYYEAVLNRHRDRYSGCCH